MFTIVTTRPFPFLNYKPVTEKGESDPNEWLYFNAEPEYNSVLGKKH